MKRAYFTGLLMVAWVLLITGCRTRFEEMDEIANAETGTLFVWNHNQTEIDLKPIRDMLADAEWIDGDPINKGGYWLRIDGVPDIFISEVNGCFWMEEYKGLFKISDEQRPDFYKHLFVYLEVLAEQSRARKENEANQSP